MEVLDEVGAVYAGPVLYGVAEKWSAQVGIGFEAGEATEGPADGEGFGDLAVEFEGLLV